MSHFDLKHHGDAQQRSRVLCLTQITHMKSASSGRVSDQWSEVALSLLQASDGQCSHCAQAVWGALYEDCGAKDKGAYISLKLLSL